MRHKHQHRDWDALFEDADWLFAQDEHPSRVPAAVGIASAVALERAYRRHGRRPPDGLTVEVKHQMRCRP